MKISANIAALALFTSASWLHAQMPDDNVNSDGNANTAMGTNALYENDVQQNQQYPGVGNVAAGYGTLYSNLTGDYSVAAGFQALASSNSADDNVAMGNSALASNTTGEENAATGAFALYFNQTGTENVATGAYALYLSTGSQNTGIGYWALGGTPGTYSTGGANTAVGYLAQGSFTSASNNVALGATALYTNTAGTFNNAVGFRALYNNTGTQNSASGAQALSENTDGNSNTASGTNALYHNTTGSLNIATGYEAGFNLTTGSNNIDIGNKGNAGESAIIRIGTQGTQTATYIAGIYNESVSGSALLVNSKGQLGVVPSSERFKVGIEPLSNESDRLGRLRPVSFHVRNDRQGPLQFGLIAEEVAHVYPALLVRSSSGRIDGVRYDELTPVLLKRLQTQETRIRRLEYSIAQLRAKVARTATDMAGD